MWTAGAASRREGAEVLFDEDGRLRTIPAQRKKRPIVLERIADAFEPGRVYLESEVSLIIADVNDDFCTLRRELV